MITRAVSLPTPAATLNGYLALPAGAGPHPGVVVIHEAYGLNDNIRDVAGRFAGEGYAALAVDLFTNRSRVVCMARLFGAMVTGREPAAVPELSAALDYLIALPEVDDERTGAIGFCMGGGVAIAWATSERRLRAIAPFYGTNPRPIAAVRRLCPVVGSYPGKDFTARSGRKLEAELVAAGVTHDIKIYPGTKHSFFNDQGRAYDASASEDAWRRTLSFFAAQLAPRATA